jgi:SulP family sulfate permease
MVHSLVVLLCNLTLMPFLSMVPMCALSAVLFVVCYKMVEWKGIKKLAKAPKTDILIMITTFILTVIIDLSTAIITSVFLTSLLFTARMIKISNIQDMGKYQLINEQKTTITYEIDGPLFFGVAHNLKALEKELNSQAKRVILDFNKVALIDATGLNALDRLIQTGKSMSIDFSFIKVKPHIKKIMDEAGICENNCTD